MSDFSLSIGGRPIENYTLHQVKQGVSLDEAKAVLETEKDGQDTIGLNIEGVDYLISGQGLDAKAGEAVIFEGQAAGKVAFVEQEENTFMEGLKGSMQRQPLGSLGVAVASGVQAARKEPREDVLQKVTEGPPLTRQLMEDAVEAMQDFFGFGDDD